MYEALKIFDAVRMQIPLSSSGAIEIDSVHQVLPSMIIQAPHFHKNFEVHLILEGTLKANIENQTFILHEGDIALIAPNVTHIANCDPLATFKTVTLAFKLIAAEEELSKSTLEDFEIYQINHKLKHCRFWTGSDNYGCLKILDDICGLTTKEASGYFLQARNLFANLIISMIQNIPSDISNDHGKVNMEKSIGTQIMRYIYTHYNEDISPQTASELFNMTPRHVNRILTATLNGTFSQILTDVRLQRVKEHLRNGKYSHEQIAELTGFSSSSYLQRLFRNINGMTMAKYGQLYRSSLFPDENATTKET